MDGYLFPLYTGGNILGFGMRERSPEPMDGYLPHLYTGGNILGCGMRELPYEPTDGYLCPLYTGGNILACGMRELPHQFQWMDIFVLCALWEYPGLWNERAAHRAKGWISLPSVHWWKNEPALDNDIFPLYSVH
jgi:hypothetical protein